MTKPILELRSVCRAFGGVKAVTDVNLTFTPGEIVGLIGPNGAGKTTLVNLISGFVPVSSGEIVYDGMSLRNSKPHMIARSGIGRTFQIVQPFAEMTVLENVMAAALYAADCNMKEAKEFAWECLTFTKLDRFADSPAAQMALANRKRLELAKSLAMKPRVLMLDEVNAGLNSSEIDQAIDMIRKIAARGITIIVIEHLMRIVRELAPRAVVLHHGAVLCSGPTDEVFNDPQVIEAYLGTKFAQRVTTEAR
jgi:branched-chain amino acid transport system ATP-binding protein